MPMQSLLLHVTIFLMGTNVQREVLYQRSECKVLRGARNIHGTMKCNSGIWCNWGNRIHVIALSQGNRKIWFGCEWSPGLCKALQNLHVGKPKLTTTKININGSVRSKLPYKWCGTRGDLTLFCTSVFMYTMEHNVQHVLSAI